MPAFFQTPGAMVEQEILMQGSARELKITLLDKQTQDPIDVTASGRKLLIVLLEEDARVIQRFKYPSEAFFENINTDSSAAGEYIIRLSSEKTQGASPGTLSIEVKFTEPNANFSDGVFTDIVKIPWAIIEKSATAKTNV